MAHQLAKVEKETGEILVEHFDATAYLAGLDTTQQQALAAAYDAACKALIGPNDVQQESGRTFKKKSAWRKLARHFRISTEVTSTNHDYLDSAEGKPPIFLAVVTVAASAPWGQSTEAVGACATDEAVGRRVISIADALATAETRATNRAVSNLIAMGEVSAEEIAPRPSHGSAPRPASKASGPAPTGGFVMPFGKSKGTLLTALKTEDLVGALTWAREKGKFEEFQEAAALELDRRNAPTPSFDQMPESLRDEDGDLRDYGDR